MANGQAAELITPQAAIVQHPFCPLDRILDRLTQNLHRARFLQRSQCTGLQCSTVTDLPRLRRQNDKRGDAISATPQLRDYVDTRIRAEFEIQNGELKIIRSKRTKRLIYTASEIDVTTF
jgi:hypothetical protein